MTGLLDGNVVSTVQYAGIFKYCQSLTPKKKQYTWGKTQLLDYKCPRTLKTCRDDDRVGIFPSVDYMHLKQSVLLDTEEMPNLTKLHGVRKRNKVVCELYVLCNLQ